MTDRGLQFKQVEINNNQNNQQQRCGFSPIELADGGVNIKHIHVGSRNRAVQFELLDQTALVVVVDLGKLIGRNGNGEQDGSVGVIFLEVLNERCSRSGSVILIFGRGMTDQQTF